MKQEPFILKDTLLHVENWEQHNVHAHFSTRNGGTSVAPYNTNNLAFHVGDDVQHVLKNRETYAAKLGTTLENFVFGAQNHGIQIVEVTSKDKGAGIHDFESGIAATDALYTFENDITLATFYADCTPLYFTSPKHHLIGIAHSGWQGTVKGMMHHFLTHWIDDLNIDPCDIYVTIGPAISKSAYPVDDTVIKEVLTFPYFNATPALTRLTPTHAKFDGQLLNLMMAEHKGIPSENIQTTAYCTYCDEDLFFSFRRDGSCGRMLATISQSE